MSSDPPEPGGAPPKSTDLDALFKGLKIEIPAEEAVEDENAPLPEMTLPDVGQAATGDALLPFPDAEPLPIAPLRAVSSGGYLVVKLDLRARGWLVAPADRFLTDEGEGEVVPMIESLRFGNFNELADQVVAKLVFHLGETDPVLRRRAVTMTAKVFRNSNPDRAWALHEKFRGQLVAMLEKETDSGVLTALGDAWLAVVELAWSQKKLEFLADLVKTQLRRVGGRDLLARLPHPAFHAKTAELVKAGAPNPLLEAIRKGNLESRDAAWRAAPLFGAPLLPELEAVIRTSEFIDARQAAARAIKEIGGSGPQHLASLVKPDAEPRMLVRILGVLDVVATPTMSVSIQLALQHKDPEVQTAAFKLVRRLEKGPAVAILRQALASAEPRVVDAAMITAKDLAYVEVVPEIAKRLDEAKEEPEIRKILEILAAVPAPTAIQSLRKVFEQRKKFPMFKGLNDDVRALAVAIAARIQHPAAQELVEEAKDDKSDLVRKAANRKR